MGKGGMIGCLVWREGMSYDRHGTMNRKADGWTASMMYI